ncbi:MAG: (2Fe-2S)-binding protein [Maricaulis sp.]|jgi:choline monooxygenase|nr:(2Fe-2S)-binding protein [Maricaulis sp.]
MDDRITPRRSGLESRPLDEASALPAEYYQGDHWDRFDREHLLAPGWQVVAPASALSGSGDHIVRELGGKPVIIVRKPDGALAGYYNICRHRAGPLALCDGKGAKRLRCAYHGWIYDLDGQLKVAPEMQGARDFDHKSIRLWPIDVREWQGMVFARAGNGTAFEAMMGDIGERLAPYRLGEMRHHTSRVYEVESNWKVYADNYLEGYHVPVLHPGLNALIDYRDYRIELFDWGSLQVSPVSGETGPYAKGEALYVYLFPNTMLNILPGRMQTNRIVADGANRCRVEFDFYYAPGNEARAAEDDAFSDSVQEEDRLICQRVQKALETGVYTPGRYCPAQEAALWQWHDYLRGIYADAD